MNKSLLKVWQGKSRERDKRKQSGERQTGNKAADRSTATLNMERDNTVENKGFKPTDFTVLSLYMPLFFRFSFLRKFRPKKSVTVKFRRRTYLVPFMIGDA